MFNENDSRGRKGVITSDNYFFDRKGGIFDWDGGASAVFGLDIILRIKKKE